ncbi:MAG: hypothetical protein ACN6OI_06450 [Flavobacterium sp.]|uniref:hypothetical protein n=1 Tax=Flavobacterium sp. TaxID=239 RepID=UPI003D12AFF1
MRKKVFGLLLSGLLLSCKSQDSIENYKGTWIEVQNRGSEFLIIDCGYQGENIKIINDSIFENGVMESTKAKIDHIKEDETGVSLFTDKTDKSYYKFLFVNKEKGLAKWEIKNNDLPIVIKYFINEVSANKIKKIKGTNDDCITNDDFEDDSSINQTKDFIENYKAKYKSKKYNIRIEKDCDLNMDGQTDKIIIFEPFEISDNKLTKESPVCVFIKKGENYDVYENKNIVYTSFFNSMAEGLQDLVVKNSYFTFEENNQAGDIRGNDYITFKYDLKSKEIILHKYSIEIITVDGGENDKTFTYGKEVFGNIFFNDFDIDKIKEKINN